MRKKEPEINLHLGCSLQAMREMKDNQYDLAIIDPPYGINMGKDMATGWASRQSNTKFSVKNWDSDIPSEEYFKELFRVSKNQIIWGGNYFIKYLSNTRCFIVWDKNNGESFFADGELAWTSFDKVVKIARINWAGGSSYLEDTKGKIHPTQKPIELYKYCLEKFAKDGDKILDTHLGSGSIACACYDLGFDLDAWEIDKDYYRDTLVRYNNYSKQIKLF